MKAENFDAKKRESNSETKAFKLIKRTINHNNCLSDHMINHIKYVAFEVSG